MTRCLPRPVLQVAAAGAGLLLALPLLASPAGAAPARPAGAAALQDRAGVERLAARTGPARPAPRDPARAVAAGQVDTLVAADYVQQQHVEGTPLEVTFYVYNVSVDDSTTPTGDIVVQDVDEAGQPAALPVATAALQPDPEDPSVAYADVTVPDGVAALHDLQALYSGDSAHASSGPAPAYLEVVSADPDRQYLQRLYLDVLDRLPDDEGFDYWLPIVQQGKRADTAYAFTLTQEFFTGEIVETYQRFLGHDPDAGGLAYYRKLFAQGLTVQDLKTDVVDSPEYYSGVSSDSAFLDKAYQDFFERGPDSAGKAYYVGLLQSRRTTRANIAYELAVSDEHQRFFLDDAYGDLLERNVDDGGLAYWSSVVRKGYRQELVTFSIAVSPEYARFLAA